MNTGEKTGIDYIHTAASQQRQWFLLTFWKLCEARYKTLMTTPKDLSQDTQEKQPAELWQLVRKHTSPSPAWKCSIDAAADSNLKQEQVRMENKAWTKSLHWGLSLKS